MKTIFAVQDGEFGWVGFQTAEEAGAGAIQIDCYEDLAEFNEVKLKKVRQGALAKLTDDEKAALGLTNFKVATPTSTPSTAGSHNHLIEPIHPSTEPQYTTMDNRTYRIGKPTKALVALASVVVSIVIGTLVVENGFWVANFQGVFHEIPAATQTTSMPIGSRHKEINEKTSPQLAPGGPGLMVTEQVTPEGLERQATLTEKKDEDIGKMGSPLRGATEPGHAPASSLKSSTPGRIASPPLPEGFGFVEIEDEKSPDGEPRLSAFLSAKDEIKPETLGEPKPSAEILSQQEVAEKPQETLAIGEPGSVPAPSSGLPASTKVPTASTKLIARKGEFLNRIVSQNYPENKKLGLEAIILANGGIDNENIIHPGQVLYLPEIHFAKQTIRLENNLFYAIYGYYQSSESLNEDTAWLAKKNVHFVVRDTKENARGNTVHRVFLGGYEKEEELEKAFEEVKTKAK